MEKEEIKQYCLWLKENFGDDFILTLLVALIAAHQGYNFKEMVNELYITNKQTKENRDEICQP